jgi:hypothetical protein
MSATHGVSLQLDRAERACGCPRYPLRILPYVWMPTVKNRRAYSSPVTIGA